MGIWSGATSGFSLALLRSAPGTAARCTATRGLPLCPSRAPCPPPLQAFLGAITGINSFAGFSAACMFPDADAAEQARIALLSSLLMPVFVLTSCLAIWGLRYC